ncbi:patatin-like phospholipase family protein [Actinokineospora soli]|uniref:Patatin-like phospholipase family protein n=1 Tax=Actinokineospora soli TaxID=1048753 RepID=A0ABW2TPR8_9PSEU
MTEHEVRVALVLNGGVSLAVWMGGVTHELDLVRRASGSNSASPSQPYDEELARRWRDLCHSGDEPRRVVVDVIAGTSAGGLNGSLLATAIANGSTLDPDGGNEPWLRQKWVELGSLSRKQLVPATGVNPRSVLDGDYFHRQLESLVEEVVEAGESAAQEPVTLFVTASGLGVQQFEATDAAKQSFVVPDHRFLFQFTSELTTKYEGGEFSEVRTNELNDTDLLARAARASASFPAAFAPIQETPELAAAPPRLRPKTAGPAWLVDGGVLDNAPFGPVLDVVARRPVTGKASRYVLYVVPSAGVGSAETALVGDDAPSWWKAALSAVQFPREVDFRSDVEQLERLLLEADASWSDTQLLFDRCVALPAERDRLEQAARALQPTYSRGRAAGGVWEAVTVGRNKQTTVLDIKAVLSEEDIVKILASNPPWVANPDADTSPRPLCTDDEGKPIWPWGTSAAERVLRVQLRSLRNRLDSAAPAERDALPRRLEATSLCLRRTLAVRDALAAELAALGLSLDAGARAVAEG